MEFDFATIGETMAGFVRTEEPDRYRLIALGAESNVAVGLAQLGCKTRWASRLGNDELGHFVASEISSKGVDAVVEWDNLKQTGLMIKEIASGNTRVRYYRSNSAATGLGVSHLTHLRSANWIHVTGITPVVSTSARELVDAVLRRDGHSAHLSFDFNFRTSLWPSRAEASKVLVGMARLADVVFIGEDEAQSLLHTDEPREIADAILGQSGQEVVLKRGDREALVMTIDTQFSEPSLEVKVAELTGAGDAFAAGYLAATNWGWSSDWRLQLGHFMAARAIGALGDWGPDLSSDELAQIRKDPTALKAAAPGGE